MDANGDARRAAAPIRRGEEQCSHHGAPLASKSCESCARSVPSITCLTTYTQTRTQVVENDSANDQELCHRAEGLLLLGAIFESIVPDELEEENRELEWCAYLPPHPAYMLTLTAQGRREGCQAEEQAGAVERRYAGRAGPRAESYARNAS